MKTWIYNAQKKLWTLFCLKIIKTWILIKNFRNIFPTHAQFCCCYTFDVFPAILPSQELRYRFHIYIPTILCVQFRHVRLISILLELLSDILDKCCHGIVLVVPSDFEHSLQMVFQIHKQYIDVVCPFVDDVYRD
jgi:hypothetical protein